MVFLEALWKILGGLAKFVADHWKGVAAILIIALIVLISYDQGYKARDAIAVKAELAAQQAANDALAQQKKDLLAQVKAADDARAKQQDIADKAQAASDQYKSESQTYYANWQEEKKHVKLIASPAPGIRPAGSPDLAAGAPAASAGSGQNQPADDGDGDPVLTVGAVGLFNLAIQGRHSSDAVSDEDVAAAAGLDRSLAGSVLSDPSGLRESDLYNTLANDAGLLNQCLSDRSTLYQYIQNLKDAGLVQQ